MPFENGCELSRLLGVMLAGANDADDSVADAQNRLIVGFASAAATEDATLRAQFATVTCPRCGAGWDPADENRVLVSSPDGENVGVVCLACMTRFRA